MNSLLTRPSRQAGKDGSPAPVAAARLRPRLLRLKRRTYVIGGVAIAALVVIVAWLLCFSSIFALKSIVVEGLRGVSPTDVAQRAGLTRGMPLARINLGAVETRIGEIAEIDSVTASRRWPNTIVISIVERDRVGYVKDGDGYLIIDANGAVFGRRRKQPRDLPLLDAIDGPNRVAVIAVLASLPDDVAGLVKSATAENPAMVLLHLTKGVSVLWGTSDQSDVKVQVVRALLADTNHDWIDVRLPDTPSSAQVKPTPAPPPSKTPSPTPSGPSIAGAPQPSASGGVQGLVTEPTAGPSLSLAPRSNSSENAVAKQAAVPTP